jgi:TRAP-type mannitol/chloroaromatic compound transport system permease large subunit
VTPGQFANISQTRVDKWALFFLMFGTIILGIKTSESSRAADGYGARTMSLVSGGVPALTSLRKFFILIKY